MSKAIKTGIYFRRPLFLTLSLSLASFAFSVFLTGSGKLCLGVSLLAVSFLCALFMLLPRVCKTRVLHISLTLILVALPLLLSYRAVDSVEALCREERDKPIQATMVIESLVSKFEGGGFYRARLVTLGAIETDAAVLVYISQDDTPSKNDTLTASIKLSPIKEDEFSNYYMADGIIFKATIQETLAYQSSGQQPLTESKLFVAKRLQHLFMTKTDKESATLISALFLGDKSDLSDRTSLDFRRLGISHLAAVSGLHISILIYGLESILHLFKTPRLARTVISILLLLFYLLLIGFPISALRAAAMFMLVILSYYIGGRYDSLTALALVAVLFCFLSPYTVYDLAFWLSVTATAGVLIVVSKEEIEEKSTEEFVVPPIPMSTLKGFFKRSKSAVFSYIKNSLLISFGAICATLPITACVFGYFSLLSAFATLALTPLVQLLMYGAVLFPLLCFFPPFCFLIKLTAHLALTVISSLSSINHTVLSMNNPLTKWLLILTVCTLFLFKIFPITKALVRRAVYASLALLLSVYLCVIGFTRYREQSFDFLQYSSNEIVTIRSHGEVSVFMLKSFQADYVLSILDTYESLYLDRLILTKCNNQSPNELRTLLSTVKTETVFLPEPQSFGEKHLADELQSAIRDNGVSCRFYKKDTETALGDSFYMTDFSAEPHDEDDRLLRITHNETQILYAIPSAYSDAATPVVSVPYQEADILILGRMYVPRNQNIIINIPLPRLKLLINANQKATVQIAASDEHSFRYLQAPAKLSYSLDSQ